MNNTSSQATEQWMNVFSAATIGTLSFAGLSLYILVISVIIRNPQTFSQNSYYTFLTSLALSDCILLSLYCFYAVPCTIKQGYILGDNFDIFIGVVFNMAYFTCLATMALIGINRYWAVCRFGTLNTAFTTRNSRFCIIVVWTFGIVFGSFQVR